VYFLYVKKQVTNRTPVAKLGPYVAGGGVCKRRRNRISRGKTMRVSNGLRMIPRLPDPCCCSSDVGFFPDTLPRVFIAVSLPAAAIDDGGTGAGFAIDRANSRRLCCGGYEILTAVCNSGFGIRGENFFFFRFYRPRMPPLPSHPFAPSNTLVALGLITTLTPARFYLFQGESRRLRSKEGRCPLMCCTGSMLRCSWACSD